METLDIPEVYSRSDKYCFSLSVYGECKFFFLQTLMAPKYWEGLK